MTYDTEYWKNWFSNQNSMNEKHSKRLEFTNVADILPKNVQPQQHIVSPRIIAQCRLCSYNKEITFVLNVLEDDTLLVEPWQASKVPPQMPYFQAQEIHIYQGKNEPNGMTNIEFIAISNQQFFSFYAYMETRLITFLMYSADQIQMYRIKNSDNEGMTKVVITRADGFSYFDFQPTPLVENYPIWQGPNSDNISVSLNPNQIMTQRIINGFIETHSVVALKNNVIIYFTRYASRNRHLPITAQDLKNDFYDYFDSHPFINIQSKTEREEYFDRLTKYFNDEIKQHQHGLRNLIPLTGNQVMFGNGYYDLKTKAFTEIVPENSGAYFNLFSIDIPYNGNDKDTTNFDKLLGDMFKDNTREQKKEGEPSYTVAEKIHFAYQVIGALITPKSIKKSIFLFQGVSNGGKTRLSNLIAKLLPKNDVRVLSSLSHLEAVEKYGLADPVRLVSFKEAYGNRVSIEKFVSLKALSLDDGEADVVEMPLKFLINTNHKIEYPVQNGTPKSFTNRIVVVPFATEMDNSAEGVSNFEDAPEEASDRKISYFEKEKMAIIHKALDAFSEVINNGNKFCCDFPINMYVEENEKNPSEDSQELQERIKQARSLSFSKDTGREGLHQLIASIFTPTNEHMKEMTPERVTEILNNIRPGTYGKNGNFVVGKDITAAFNKSVTLKNGIYNMTIKQDEYTEQTVH